MSSEHVRFEFLGRGGGEGVDDGISGGLVHGPALHCVSHQKTFYIKFFVVSQISNANVRERRSFRNGRRSRTLKKSVKKRNTKKKRKTKKDGNVDLTLTGFN